MNVSKMVIIGLAIVLAAVAGYTLYLQQGPLKSTSEENQILKNEIGQLKSAARQIKSTHKNEIGAKIQLLESLQKEKAKLEETVSRISHDRKAEGAEFQKKIENLERRLAQSGQELAKSREETQQLKATSQEATAVYKAELADKIRRLEDLQRKSSKLEETLVRNRKETETRETDLWETINNLQNQLAQWDLDLQTSREEVQKLRNTIALLESDKVTLDQKSEDLNRLLLDSRNQLIRIAEISVGSLDSSIVHPREVFKEAISASAASVIFVHNHPSGDTEASEDDIQLTKRLADVGEIIGIEVLDHVIIGGKNYISLKREGLF